MKVPAEAIEDGEQGTKRFRAKRDAILAAAAEAINEQSAKGMTFADVARRVGLNTTSVTYYFKRKEDLAAAAFENTLDYLLRMLDEAMVEPTPQARVARYLALNMARLGRIQRGEEKAFAVLSDLRATEDPIRSRLMNGWREVFRRTRLLWGPSTGRAQTDIQSARAHVLLENTFWLPIWLTRYEPDQYARVEARLMDVFAHGIAGPGARWAPTLLDLSHDDAEPGREAFLLAATRLINELGYRGASVQKIASELNVTKGSFYHHLDAKDDLVIACYRRSFDTIADAQGRGEAEGGSYWHKLSSTVATLLDVQFAERGPLLRTTALSGLPPSVRDAMVERSNGIARRYAGMMMDGIGEGSIRAVDALIAAQALMAVQNAAFDMRKWASTMPRERAVAMYASTLMYGLFDD
ncbi:MULTISPECIES: TetR/AcrR family transcriptional regulator [Sphingomonas]|jgi:AcrR family transcriptional regulator|uniref:TetR/AcrR family transcriptional regulator n=1 Tax=Sphingomonas TaxID=13687 RepID=UPI000700B319|nr:MULTISPECIES: TetR/AcrR family transcriptional regulator [Sphingomonas]KQM94866.1 TetR family transcriptional regulator [Sphingomonas sp. Leaf226]MBB3587257.1 AcrR family transcriptional regulator [Sphingomonas sp. BK481]MBD8734630.1 TetR/AcrR family transcriptional regulator [Sphingomonas sp. CFBP 13706]MDY0968262.1 TetR/AcrR family transcriptional regulator [Sphingomonas sp. CFBP9021]USR01408.1 TetR/AcrR family transcriptional regulator [Sphingomonas aerolata]